MKVSYFPGCTLKNKAKDLDLYAYKSAEALGVTLEEIENWQCCGGVYTTAKNEVATKLSSVRALKEAASKELLETLNLAIDGMLSMRKREGDNLVASILSKIDSLESIRGEVVARAPEVVEAYKQKLSARINEILTSDQREFYDDNRLKI